MDPNIDPDYRNAPRAEVLHWPLSVAGQHALAWEQAQVDQWVADVFGYHAVQLGLPELQALRGNRMPHRWLLSPQELSEPTAFLGSGSPGPRSAGPAVPGEPTFTVSEPSSSTAVHLLAEFHALPFATNSLDLVVMPHTLEVAADAHQTLREAERVLRPEGRLLITGFNPASLWGVARRSRWGMGASLGGSVASMTGANSDWVGYWRLRDWLRLLSFEVEGGRFGCYVPPVRSPVWLERFGWMEPLGDRWWPVLGGVYAVMAIKRVRGMRLVGLARQAKGVKAPAHAVVTQRHQRTAAPGRSGAVTPRSHQGGA